MLLALAQRVAFGSTLRVPLLARGPQIHSISAFPFPALILRPFLTTSRVLLPAASTAKKTKKDAPKKAAAKKTTTSKKKPAKKTTAKVSKKLKGKAAKKKGVKKAKAKPKAKKPKVEKPKRLTAADKPPKSPGSPFIQFWMDYLKRPDVDKLTREGLTEASRKAGVEWHALPESEKEVYRKRHQALVKDYLQKRFKYFDTVSTATLRRVNSSRVRRNKHRVVRRKSPENRRPNTSYFRFLKDFRVTPEAKEAAARNPAIGARNVALLAGEKWKGMSEAQKKPYADAYRSEMETWKASHPSK